MPRRAILRTILATMIGLAIWVPASAATAADPCCQASVSGMPSQFTAGAEPQFFSTTMSYNGSNGMKIKSVTATFTFAGEDLSSGQVQLARMRDGRWRSISVGRHDGKLMGVDNFSINGNGGSGGSINSQYRIAFGPRVHSQAVEMLFAMEGRLDDGHHTTTRQLSQAGPFTMTVTAAGGAPTPTPTKAQAPAPTPTATPTPTPTVAEQPSAGAGATLPGAGGAIGAGTSGSGGSSGGWIAYMIGGLLLIGGIGAIGTILWKRGNQSGEPAWEEPYADQPYAPQPYAQQPYGQQPSAQQPYGQQQTYGQQTYPNPAGYAAPTTAVPAHPPTEAFNAVRPPLDPTRPMPRQ